MSNLPSESSQIEFFWWLISKLYIVYDIINTLPVIIIIRQINTNLKLLNITK